MSSDLLLDEVEVLHSVCTRLEKIAENSVVGPDLLAVAGSIRNSATLLGVIVATKLHRRDGL
jgi:hypothetical protein